jgi:AraC-like DNA-binding protein/quercetin dioxygenase-like cupin family protein
MEIIERKVILPENQSFIIRQIELKNNTGVIHTHEKYELNFIIDAYGRRFVAGNISKFVPGDLIFMAPGVPHCWEIENKEMLPKAITIHFNKDFFENLLVKIPELGFLQNFIKKSKQGLFIKGIETREIEALLNEAREKKSFDGFMAVLQLLRHISSQESLLLANKEYEWNFELPQNQRLRKIQEHVFHHFQDNIKLNEIASLIGLSEGAFCSFFKKNTKKTFFTFLKEIRISYACKLLTEDADKPISDICFESGFNNYTNFNRQFKEITGNTPKEYRERH